MAEAPTCQRPPVGPPYSPAVHNPTNVPTPVTLKLVLVTLVPKPVVTVVTPVIRACVELKLVAVAVVAVRLVIFDVAIVLTPVTVRLVFVVLVVNPVAVLELAKVETPVTLN